MKSIFSILSICIVVLMQVFSTGFSLNKKTCAHTQEVSYSFSETKCTCTKHVEVKKSCCASKNTEEVKKRCCELETITAFVDYKNISPDFISFNAPIYEVTEIEFDYIESRVVIQNEIISIYDPPPLLYGTQLRKNLQSFQI